MGVPVITLAGQYAVARAGVSILSNVGLPQSIAQNTENYARLAIDLAHDVAPLAHLRRRLREQMRTSPLCDAVAFTRSIESAYRGMFQRWCAT